MLKIRKVDSYELSRNTNSIGIGTIHSDIWENLSGIRFITTPAYKCVVASSLDHGVLVESKGNYELQVPPDVTAPFIYEGGKYHPTTSLINPTGVSIFPPKISPKVTYFVYLKKLNWQHWKLFSADTSDCVRLCAIQNVLMKNVSGVEVPTETGATALLELCKGIYAEAGVNAYYYNCARIFNGIGKVGEGIEWNDFLVELCKETPSEASKDEVPEEGFIPAYEFNVRLPVKDAYIDISKHLIHFPTLEKIKHVMWNQGRGVVEVTLLDPKDFDLYSSLISETISHLLNVAKERIHFIHFELRS